MKIFKITEVLYLVAALFFVYESFSHWATDRSRAFLYLLFVVMAVFMFFFKRRFRKKIEKQRNNN